MVLGFGLFFGASDRKEAEMDFVRRWRDEFAREEFVAGQRDVEASENERLFGGENWAWKQFRGLPR